MRFSAVVSTLFAATVLASPSAINIGKRQVATIIAQFTAVNAKLDDFNTKISALSLTDDIAKTSASLASSSVAIVKALNDGVTNINAAKAIQILEATQLLAEGSKLQANADKAIQALIGKKDIIAKAKQNQVVVKQLQDQKTATQGFAKAIAEKLPPAVRSAADSLVGKVVTSIDGGIKAFS